MTYADFAKLTKLTKLAQEIDLLEKHYIREYESCFKLKGTEFYLYLSSKYNMWYRYGLLVSYGDPILSRRGSFEVVLELVPDEIKEEMIYHLDFFKYGG